MELNPAQFIFIILAYFLASINATTNVSSEVFSVITKGNVTVTEAKVKDQSEIKFLKIAEDSKR